MGRQIIYGMLFAHALVLLAAGCCTPKFEKKIVIPLNGLHFHTIGAIAYLNNDSLRILMENSVAGAIEQAGMRGVPGNALFPLPESFTPEEIRERMRLLNIRAFIVITNGAGDSPERSDLLQAVLRETLTNKILWEASYKICRGPIDIVFAEYSAEIASGLIADSLMHRRGEEFRSN